MSRAAMADAVDIPTQWKIKELKVVVDINPESRDPTQTPLEKFFYVDIDAVENGSGVISTVKELIGKDAPSRARRVVHTDDVIMSEIRPYLKAFALVPKKLNNQICSTGFAVLRSKGEIDPQYLLNILFSNDVIDQCNRMMVGAQYPALNDSQVKKIRIPLPPLSEQRSIAAIFHTVDDAIQRSRLAAAETEHLKAGVMQELMMKGIGHTEFKMDEDVGKVPKGWEIKQLGEVCTVKTEPFGAQLHMSDYVEKGTPIITVEHLGDLGVIHEKLPLVSDADKARLSEYLLKEGDIVFSRVGSVDRSCYISKKESGWLFSGRLLRVRPATNELLPSYLNNYFRFEGFKHRIRNASVGGTMANLNTTIMNQIKIIFPPIYEQQKIADILSIIDRKLTLQRQRTAHYERLKQGLMNELLTGKRRVKVT